MGTRRSGGGAVIVERIAEPLPGGRAQLVETCFDVDATGRSEQLYSVQRGSPAAAEVVARHEETLTMDAAGVRRSRP